MKKLCTLLLLGVAMHTPALAPALAQDANTTGSTEAAEAQGNDIVVTASSLRTLERSFGEKDA